MIIRIAELLDRRLVGRTAGKRHFGTICAELAQAAQGELIVLDFSEVTILTGSWVNSALAPLYRWAMTADNDVFPLISALDEEWLDDVRIVAEWNYHCYLVTKEQCEIPSSARIIGSLDPGQRTTLDVVQRFGKVTGAQLERNTDEGVRATAWNNRLRDLFNKRVVRRERRGREQVYSKLVEEIISDG